MSAFGPEADVHGRGFSANGIHWVDQAVVEPGIPGRYDDLRPWHPPSGLVKLLQGVGRGHRRWIDMRIFSTAE